MATLSLDEKKQVRELVQQWLDMETKWSASRSWRLVLLVLVLPFYYLNQLVYGLVVSVLLLFAIVFTILMCFVVCFRLDPVVRACFKACCCGVGAPPAEKPDPAVNGENNELDDQTMTSFFMIRLLRYQLWAKLTLFSPGRFLIRKDLEDIEKESAKLLLQRSDFTYVMTKETVLALTEWPKHEQALQENKLVRISIDKIRPPQSGARVLTSVLFVSHKWVGNLPDMEQQEILAQVKERLSQSPQTYIWFDYACVPQEDAHQRNLHLRSIPDIISRCNVGIFLHKDVQWAEKYMCSVWCQLEFVLSGLNMKAFKGVTRQWTIYDYNDLYLILPAFIKMTCENSNFTEVFGGIRTVGGHLVFGDILRFFAKHHDEHIGTTNV